MGLGMLKNVQSGWKIFTLSHVAYVKVDFKKAVGDLISPWFNFGRKRMFHKKNEAIRIAQKHNNSLRTFTEAPHNASI